MIENSEFQNSHSKYKKTEFEKTLRQLRKILIQEIPS